MLKCDAQTNSRTRTQTFCDLEVFCTFKPSVILPKHNHSRLLNPTRLFRTQSKQTVPKLTTFQAGSSIVLVAGLTKLVPLKTFLISLIYWENRMGPCCVVGRWLPRQADATSCPRRSLPKLRLKWPCRLTFWIWCKDTSFMSTHWQQAHLCSYCRQVLTCSCDDLNPI